MSINDDNAPFSSAKAIKLFQDCVLDDGSVCINTYARGFFELVKMINLLGKLFSFAGALMTKDLHLLLGLQDEKDGEHYIKLHTMMEHEKSTKDPKGTKIFRRFHYTLEFMAELLDKLKDVERDAGLSQKTLEIYRSKLLTLQPWWLQNASLIALRTLPTKLNFIRKLHPELEDPHDLAVSEAEQSAKDFKKLYEVCEQLFVENDFRDLPWF